MKLDRRQTVNQAKSPRRQVFAAIYAEAATLRAHGWCIAGCKVLSVCASAAPVSDFK